MHIFLERLYQNSLKQYKRYCFSEGISVLPDVKNNCLITPSKTILRDSDKKILFIWDRKNHTSLRSSDNGEQHA